MNIYLVMINLVKVQRRLQKLEEKSNMYVYFQRSHHTHVTSALKMKKDVKLKLTMDIVKNIEIKN